MSFKDKTLLITGGTGSFGNAVLKRFLDTDIHEIRIFSRDEKKQDDMRHFYNSQKIKYYIGDVRDKRSLDNVMQGVDYLFHAAALKQVPSCEAWRVGQQDRCAHPAGGCLRCRLHDCLGERATRQTSPAPPAKS